MLKKALICSLVPVLLYAAELVQQFNFETPKVIDGIVYLNGCHPTEDGFAPMLAEKPVTLLLPLGYTAVSFNVEFSEPVELESEYYVKPFRPSVSEKSNMGRDFMTKVSAVYSQNSFYPAAKRSSWFDIQYKNGHPIFVTAIRPVQYNPVTGKLRYSKSVKIAVTTAATKAPAPYLCTPFIKSQLRSIVDNPEAVNNLPLTTKEADDYEMLIITSDALKSAWTAYVDFNKRRCLRTKIETLQNIKATVTGVDDPEKMRNYIKKEYTDNKIVYVLLGGDATANQAYNIPVRNFRAQMYDHNISAEKWHDEKDLPADGLYFGCLDGNWKPATDDYGMPGDRDMFAEVYVTRFPVDNTTQLNSMVNKSIKYSETPVRDQVKRNMLSGNYLWENGGVTCWGIDNSELYMDYCTQNGYATYGFPKSAWTTERICDKTTSGWTITTWRALVKSHKPTWIDHNGHGNYTQAFNETNSGVTTTNYPQDGASANYFIITTGICCYPGGFDKSECLLEAFVNLSTGCVAAITNARTGWGDDDGTAAPRGSTAIFTTRCSMPNTGITISV